MIIIKCENKVNISFTVVSHRQTRQHTHERERESVQENQTINDARLKTSESCM